LYNNQHSLAKKVCTQYQNANKAIIQMKSDIQQFIYNQRTLEEQLLQHQKTYQEFAGRLKVLVEETKKSELQLVKLRGNCDQLQTSVLKTEDDHYQQSQRYEVESQRLEQLYVMLDQQERLNQTKKTQIISLHNELKTLELRLDDINTQLSDLRQLDEIQNMEKKEKELFESKQDITFQLSKSKEQLDTINASIHTRELHQQSLLKTIGPETQGMALELQNSVDMLLSEIGAIQRALEQTNTKITQYEVLIPQRREELELLKFELEQDSNFYDGLVQNLNEKKDGQKMDENNIEKLENEITQIQSKKHNDELQLSTDHEKWLLDNKLERESIENDVSTMRSRHNAKLQLLIQNCEKEIADFENQRDKLITLHESKSTSYSLLQDEFKLTSQQITSLQIQVDRFVELHAMSGPQLQHRITELISQQAKRSARIRQLKEQNSTYDDENLLLRRQKLQKVRDSNSEMENQIVQLGGSNLLSSLTRPQITPTYDQLSVHDLPQDDSYTDYIDDAPSHLCDTIYGIEDDIDGEETSARCDGGDDDDDDDDNNNNTNNNNNQNNHNLDPKRLKNQNSRTKIDISETQSLSLPTVIRPSNKTNTLPRNNGISGQPTSSTRITSRMSALPVTSAGTNTRQVTNTSTRPLGKVTATNIVTSKTSTVGVGNTKRIGTAKQDDSLPGYMRSTTASRGGR
jgi:chromosome segregation ATPase